MNGHRINLEDLVQAPIERVWAVLTDIAHADQTLSAVEHVELLTDGPYGVGTRWRETRRMLGKKATEQMQVTVAEAPTRTVIEADSAGVHYVTEFTLTPVSQDLTMLAMSFTAVQDRASRLHRVLWLLVGRLGMKATGKAMSKDLQDITTRAERT